MKCDEMNDGSGLEEKCQKRSARSLGQRVHLGKILIDWEEKIKHGKI